MRLKLDENLPSALVAKLSGLGHDVDSVPSENLTGHSDVDVWAAAQRDQRFLVATEVKLSVFRLDTSSGEQVR